MDPRTTAIQPIFKAALTLLLDKYFPHLHSGQDYRAITGDELARTTVYRIAIDAWSGSGVSTTSSL